MLNKSILFCFFISLYGCDIPGIITVKNVSKGKAIYRYEAIKEGDSAKVYTVEMSGDEESNKASIMFGFGHLWTNQKIREYLETVNSIEIISQNYSIRLTDKEEMFRFFKKRRRGLFKNEIKIKID